MSTTNNNLHYTPLYSVLCTHNFCTDKKGDSYSILYCDFGVFKTMVRKKSLLVLILVLMLPRTLRGVCLLFMIKLHTTSLLLY